MEDREVIESAILKGRECGHFIRFKSDYFVRKATGCQGHHEVRRDVVQIGVQNWNHMLVIHLLHDPNFSLEAFALLSSLVAILECSKLLFNPVSDLENGAHCSPSQLALDNEPTVYGVADLISISDFRIWSDGNGAYSVFKHQKHLECTFKNLYK